MQKCFVSICLLLLKSINIIPGQWISSNTTLLIKGKWCSNFSPNKILNLSILLDEKVYHEFLEPGSTNFWFLEYAVASYLKIVI